MPSDQFDFVRHRPRARPITLDLVRCCQLILKLIEVICGNCLSAINDGSACSVLFLSTTGLFPVRRKISEHGTHCLLRYYPALVRLFLTNIQCEVGKVFPIF